MKTKRLSLYSYFSLILIALLVMMTAKLWQKENRVISWDVLEYYSYLPATFIYGDVKMEFLNQPDPERPNKFWPHKSPTNKWVNKFTMGMSYLYSPFFLIAHGLGWIFGFPMDGFSTPYKFMVLFSSLFFFVLGLFFLRKSLLRFFDEKTTAICLILIVLGTNLLYYVSIRSGATHSYNFSLISLFIYLTIKWHDQQKTKYSLLLGIVIGLISIIRPTNSVIILVFILYGVYDKKGLSRNFRLFFKNYYHILLMILLAIIPWIPQLLYWKAQTGEYFYYSYRDEGFHFSDPHTIKVLLSFRNGWLIYTPIMFFALAGFYFLRKKLRNVYVPFLIVTILNIYIISSWWCWWYVGYGLRAFIDSYALMSFPLAAIIAYSLDRKKYLKIIIFSVFFFLLFLNLFQTRQYHRGIITHDSMTRKAYWTIFLNNNPGNKHHQYLQKPDYEAAKKGGITPDGQ